MIFSNLELQVIGQGSWAKKIQKVLKEHHPELKIVNISARDFIDFPEEFLKEPEVLERIIWITSRPQLQLEILNELNAFEGKIILEKPLATSLKEFKIFEIEIEKKKNVYFSQPWTASNVWRKAKSLLPQSEYPLRIEIERSGSIQRDYVSAPQDWLPHDLFLLQDLAQGRMDLEVLGAIFTNPNSVNLNLNLKGLFTVTLNCGYTADRVANWKIYLQNDSVIDINFLENSCIQMERDKSFHATNKEEFYRDNPLVTMFEEIYKPEQGSSKYRSYSFQSIVASL